VRAGPYLLRPPHRSRPAEALQPSGLEKDCADLVVGKAERLLGFVNDGEAHPAYTGDASNRRATSYFMMAPEAAPKYSPSRKAAVVLLCSFSLLSAS
jgi:hypothetical protein